MTGVHTATAWPADDHRLGTRVGLFGGTFDPFHAGHLHVARHARAALTLDAVVILPTQAHPHRQAPVLSLDGRQAIIDRAITGEPGLMGPGAAGGATTITDALRALSRPGREIHLILGADAAARLHLWPDAEELRERSRIWVVPRDGDDGSRVPGVAPLPLPYHPLSATEVRRRAGKGESLAQLVPASVAGEVAERYSAPGVARL